MMRFEDSESSDDDESLSAPVVTTLRRRISDSDSGSEWGSIEEEAAECSAENKEELLPESSVQIDFGSLSIRDYNTQRRTGSVDDAENQSSSDGAEVCSSESYTTCRHSSRPSVGSRGDPSHKSRQTVEAAHSPTSSMTSAASIENSGEDNTSAWTLDETSDEYFLTGSVDATKGEVCWPKLSIPRDLYDGLYDHQKVGVQWLATLHNDCIGGILGDDMGLGKTYQTLTFLGGLMPRTICNALVCCPLSLLRTWENEARSILSDSLDLDVSICVISSDVPKKRRSELLKAAMSCSSKNPHLVITTYGLITSNPLDFVRTDEDGEKRAWNYVVLDEGHKIKNPSTKTNKAAHRICKNPKTRRLMLTGTPIQNNLKELWTLFDWATSSKLLGKLPNFKNRFAEPIESGRHKNASDSVVANAAKANSELQALLTPVFLQRLKSIEFKDELPSKRELVVWTHLSKKQRQLYEDYVEHGRNVRSILAGEINSPLEAITWLKKLCGHPLLVSWKKDEPKTLIQDSSKLKVLLDLLQRLRSSGHRTLVFSQSTKMLDIIENVLCDLVSLARIDGSTKERERQRIVDAFNEHGSEYDVLLLSTKAAGLGLTLTGADRCIVYDPSWNPAEDSQAVDRCFRIGQSKNVTVYRFIAAGTVEERMYEKQVAKLGIKRAIMTSQGSSTERYFDKDELRRFFQLAPEGCCEILDKLRGEKASGHGSYGRDEEHRNTSAVVGASGKPSFLDSHRHVVGLSSHDHLYNSASSTEGSGSEMLQTQSTPFSGTPLKEAHRRLDKATRALQGKRLNFGPSATDSKAARAPPYRNIRANNGSQTIGETCVARKPLSAIKCTKPGDCGVSAKEAVIGLMLEDLDNDLIKGQEKLKLHENIVRLALQLGWL